MADKAQPTDVAAASPAVTDETQAAAAPPTPTPPRRSPGHRGQDMRDTMAEMAARAHEISLEAGSKMSGAMRDVINAAAGLAGFAVESARDLVQYMVRRGQMTQDEADKLIREAEEAYNKRPRPAAESRAGAAVESGSADSNGASRDREARTATTPTTPRKSTEVSRPAIATREPAVTAATTKAAPTKAAPTKAAVKGPAPAPAAKSSAAKAPAKSASTKAPAAAKGGAKSAAKGGAKTASKSAAKKPAAKKK